MQKRQIRSNQDVEIEFGWKFPKNDQRNQRKEANSGDSIPLNI